jgi:hypothetical protein
MTGGLPLRECSHTLRGERIITRAVRCRPEGVSEQSKNGQSAPPAGIRARDDAFTRANTTGTTWAPAAERVIVPAPRSS